MKPENPYIERTGGKEEKRECPKVDQIMPYAGPGAGLEAVIKAKAQVQNTEKAQ